jgi:hypothetical protein
VPLFSWPTAVATFGILTVAIIHICDGHLFAKILSNRTAAV